MFQYTKASLKTHLQLWVEGNGADADDAFIAALDEIIQRGELRLARGVDLDNLDYVLTTTTAGTVPEVFKPAELVNERLLSISIAGRKTPLLKRSRAFIEAMNRDDGAGTPRYYGEFDEDRWFVAPIPAAAYLIYVHGNWRPASIVDGNDANTTWFSTRIPDLLASACSIEAASELKFWTLKALQEAEYTAKLAAFRGIAANLKRADYEDILKGRQSLNTPTVAPDPAATE